MPKPLVSIKKNYNIFRCDRIQIPPKAGPFNSEDLEWYPSLDYTEAFIERTRVKDFIAGESTRPEFRTKFRITKTDDRTENVGKFIERYHCHFGPNDKRSEPLPPVPEKRTEEDGGRPLARTTKLHLSDQRGCLCHFAVIFLEDRKEAALLRWFQRNHVDASGAVCHGKADALGIYAGAHLAPSISDELREEIDRMLRAGVKPDAILSEHTRLLRLKYGDSDNDEPEDWSRDDLLSERDILNIKKKIDKDLFIYSQDDAICCKLWVEQNPKMVTCYQAQDKLSNPKVPFMLVWSTPWMLKKLAKHGHGSAVAMDATFATNTYEFSLFTLMAFDNHRNGIPCAYGLLEKHRSEDLVKMLSLVKKKVEDYRHNKLGLPGEWKPSCIIIDVSAEEQLALSEVMPNVPIIFCLWHVRRAWETNLAMKVKHPFAKAQINEELGLLMYNQAFQDTEAASLRFIEKWSKFEETHVFAKYYETNWHPKLARWVKSFRHFPHAGQDTNGAIEKSHSTMKRHLSGEKKVKNGRKAGWLIQMLTHDIERFFWSKSARKWQGCIRNKIVESTVLRAINHAKGIPDSNVMLQQVDGKKTGFVRSGKNPQNWHEAREYDTDAAKCTCVESLLGNTCKHQIKCLLMDGYEESTLLLILGTKMGSMCGGLDFANNLNAGEPGCVPAVDVEPSFDLNVAFPHEEELGTGNDEIQPIDTAVQMQVPTMKELKLVVDKVLLKMHHSPWLMMHAGSTLHTWEKSMYSLCARSKITDAQGTEAISQQLPTMHAMEALEGSRNTTKPILGLVDHIHKGSRRPRKRRAPNSTVELTPIQEENVNPNGMPRPFIKKKKLKENMTQRMYRLAHEEVNELELFYDDTTGNPAERKKKRKRGAAVRDVPVLYPNPPI